MIEHFIQALPLVAVIAAACAFLGWSMRGAANKPAPGKVAKPAPAPEKAQQDRAKNLEAALEKSKAANKSLKAELEALQTTSISKDAHEQSIVTADSAKRELESAGKRIAALETDLKKSQDTIRTLNARTNEGDKAQKSRTFSLENELSKAREQLALLQDRPDDSAALQEEIQRLRDSVATSTRFAGEMRKREAAAVEALEKAEARVADMVDPSRTPTTSKKIGPVVDSGRIAAAKAEVLRLVEMNRLKQAATVEPVVAEAAPAIVGENAAVAESASAVVPEPSTDGSASGGTLVDPAEISAVTHDVAPTEDEPSESSAGMLGTESPAADTSAGMLRTESNPSETPGGSLAEIESDDATKDADEPLKASTIPDDLFPRENA